MHHAGARPQRLLWAATDAEALAAPAPVISLPEPAGHVLERFQAIGSILAADGRDCEESLARFAACVSSSMLSLPPLCVNADMPPDMEKESIIPCTELPAWQKLKTHCQAIEARHLRDLLEQDPKRGERFAVDALGMYFDYSKNRIDGETLPLLFELAAQCGLRARIDAMFEGRKINTTENRAVLHTALRAPRTASILVDGTDVVPEVHRVLDRMEAFCHAVRSGSWLGHAGKRIRNVVNIGIGGSDLGPVMAYEALRPFTERSMTFRFVSNVDGTDFAEAVRDLDPAETLFIVSSKTFTTQETMTNAATARAWSLAGLGNDKRG